MVKHVWAPGSESLLESVFTASKLCGLGQAPWPLWAPAAHLQWRVPWGFSTPVMGAWLPQTERLTVCSKALTTKPFENQVPAEDGDLIVRRAKDMASRPRGVWVRTFLGTHWRLSLGQLQRPVWSKDENVEVNQE